jgi:hypothetical protein
MFIAFWTASWVDRWPGVVIPAGIVENQGFIILLRIFLPKKIRFEFILESNVAI